MSVVTGNATYGNSGAILIKSGQNGNSGGIHIKAGISTKLSGSDIRITGGAKGGETEIGFGGSVRLTLGKGGASGISGNITAYTDEADGEGESGDVVLGTGRSINGSSGSVLVHTGTSESGGSGRISLMLPKRQRVATFPLCQGQRRRWGVLEGV